ncbi:hypothetical protein RSOLAG1IB_06891 [Rhizoctonia solani AG-1 IB]|uniref:Arrestin-like N-terminal domain-containing protein n=1 Tax=Thanatephorus cucumeris (strain AG1-IB / isolate 7/3/14) TaxID=1108050 RepID=A0A0B7FDH6_THACB|nr:hypothetical protein RSOLAG1IB_06891 [Rhizoctonia solani AG-1 IB]
MGTQYGASSKPMRREPPMPLGNTVNYFSVSAATPPGATHPSGVSLRLKLDNPHQDASFRSNQLVNGRVLIQSPKSLQIPNLSLRVYFESRTLYWNLEVQDPENKVGRAISGIKSPATLNYDTVMRHEVHRGVVPASGVMLSWDAQIALEPDRDTVLPFSFIIPRKMRITEHSNSPYAPRDLCTVERCPPSTLRDSRFGSVQWVVEAVMDLTPSPTTKQDLDALLRQSTDDQIVTRIAFPFVPILEHVLPLRGEPFFGEDPSLDPFGSRRLSDEELESGKKAMMDRVRARGGIWEVYVKSFPVAGSNLWSEVYTPAGAIISTDSSKLPIVLFLKHAGAQSGFKSFFRATKPKPVHLRRALITLLRVTSTRGGKEVRPHVINTVVRKQEFLFDDQSSSSSPAGFTVSHEDPEPVEVDLTLDLQSEVSSKDHPSIPVKNLTPSFRTPNFQHEFLLTVLLSFVEDEVERFPTRFTVQVMPASDGDGGQLPAFEDAIRDNVPPPTFDESLNSS